MTGKTVLVIRGFGTFLGSTGRKFVVKRKGEKLEEIPVSQVDLVMVEGPGASVSSAALKLAVKHGVFVVLSSYRGTPYGVVTPSVMTGSVQVRRHQFLAYADKRGVVLAKGFALGKLRNQLSLLKLWAKNKRRTNVKLAEKLQSAAEGVNSTLQQLLGFSADKLNGFVQQKIMSLEAEAARYYWSALSQALPAEWEFKGRITRGATDPFNVLLNYGYKAVLFPECFRATLLAGLDPYAGYLHADRPGKPSLALDLMEEFRQHVVDRCLIAMAELNEVKPSEVFEEEHNLNSRTIELLRLKIGERLESKVSVGGITTSVKNAILHQARLIARFLQGEEQTYQPLYFGW